MKMHESISEELNEAAHVLRVFSSNPDNLDRINDAGALLVDCVQKGHKIISCGNGGSMADAIHFAEELAGRFRDNRIPIPAIAISDPGYLSCVANDYGYKEVFSRFIQGIGNKGDVLVVISTSGNSENVIEAAKMARQLQMKIIALTGKDGGKLADLADVEIRVAHNGYADRIQEVHIKVIHILIHLIERGIDH